MESAGKGGTVMCVTAPGRAILVAPVREVRLTLVLNAYHFKFLKYCRKILLYFSFIKIEVSCFIVVAVWDRTYCVFLSSCLFSVSRS